MELLTRLQDEMKAAMKAGQKDRLTVIRMLISDVKNADLMPAKPSAEQVVSAYGKKLRKGVEEYERLGKPDEVAKLRAEIAIVDEFLPKKASPEESERLVDAFLARHSFTEKQLGQAMGMLMKEHGATLDAAVVNPLLKRILAGK